MIMCACVCLCICVCIDHETREHVLESRGKKSDPKRRGKEKIIM